MGYAVKLGTDPNYTPTPRYGCIFGIPRGVGLNTYVPVRLNTYVPQCRLDNLQQNCGHFGHVYGVRALLVTSKK